MALQDKDLTTPLIGAGQAESVPGATAATPTQVRLVGFRYHPAIGGAEHYARRLLREIGDRLDMDVVTVVTANQSDWLRLLSDGVRDVDERYVVDGRPVRALGRWQQKTRQQLGRLSSLYHVPYGPVPSIMGRILAAHLAPVVAGTQLVHNVFMGREAFSLGLMLAAQRAGTPFVFTPLRHERPFGWNSPAFRQLYRSADRLVALTEAESAWLVSQGAPKDRVRVIGIGPLSNPDATPARARELLGDRKIVLFLGQLHDYKGYRQLLSASRLIADRQDVLFVFAGPDVRDHARAFAAQAGNVRYLPSVDDQLRDSLLAACAVLCVPSSRESFGIVLIDAWTCGKPVIGGPAAATRELIEDGVTGFVVPQEPAIIADRLRRVLSDEGLAHRMGDEGRARAEARFSWSSIAAAYLRLYSELGVRTRDA